MKRGRQMLYVKGICLMAVFTLALVGVGGWTCMAQTTQAAQAAIDNGSFEEANGDQPAAWKSHEWKGKGRFEYASIGKTGSRSVSIASDNGADFSWETAVPVLPYAKYRLSGWIKTENVQVTNGQGALINAHDAPIRTQALTGTNDWTQVAVEFETDERDSLSINCLFGGWGFATGQAWYDDIELTLLSRRELKPALTVQAGSTGTPVSKYVYGQFIEHLGRCIYGGIWAEMLLDRKFFYMPGAEESPWQIVGNAKIVEIKENPYAGEHTPQITTAFPNTGIAHPGLGLRAGKEYVGRIVLAGDVAAGAIQVVLSWGPGSEDRQVIPVEVSAMWKTVPFRFTAKADTEDGALSLLLSSVGAVRIGAVSLMPADNVNGMRPDTLALLKELDAPVYRWPGGNFVSGYNWKDGLGDPDKRPPRKNPAWTGVEHNDFGINEYMLFCKTINTEPLVVVNSGLGDVNLAIEELEYANGPATSPMGQLRASHGHPDPYNVVFWGVGNEMYGSWQLGHMPLADYVKKHNQYAEAMRAASPGIKLVGVGATGPWSETMLRECADHMDMLSEHFYVQEQPGVISHIRQMTDNVRAKADAQRKYYETIPSLANNRIPIALDEWNYWYGAHRYGELGTQYFLKDALGVAAGLHEMYRNSDIFFMANYAQTVNVIGAIKTNNTDAIMDTTGVVLALYRHQFGVLPVKVAGEMFPLDAQAAFTEDRKQLTLGIVNPTDTPFSVPVAFEGVELTGDGQRWVVTGPGPKAENVPGKAPEVTAVQSAVQGISGTIEAPALSVALYVLNLK